MAGNGLTLVADVPSVGLADDGAVCAQTSSADRWYLLSAAQNPHDRCRE
jgi:hypothetical protein